MLIDWISLAIGAALGFGAGWLQYYVTQRDYKSRLETSLLLELTAFAEDDADMFTTLTMHLKLIEASGIFENRRDWQRILGEHHTDRFPVYYSSIGDIGHLPTATATALFRYHTRRMSLMRSASILLETPDGPPVQHVASAMIFQISEMMESKQAAISGLSKKAATPPPTPSPAASATR